MRTITRAAIAAALVFGLSLSAPPAQASVPSPIGDWSAGRDTSVGNFTAIANVGSFSANYCTLRITNDTATTYRYVDRRLEGWSNGIIYDGGGAVTLTPGQTSTWVIEPGSAISHSAEAVTHAEVYRLIDGDWVWVRTVHTGVYKPGQTSDPGQLERIGPHDPDQPGC